MISAICTDTVARHGPGAWGIGRVWGTMFMQDMPRMCYTCSAGHALVMVQWAQHCGKEQMSVHTDAALCDAHACTTWTARPAGTCRCVRMCGALPCTPATGWAAVLLHCEAHSVTSQPSHTACIDQRKRQRHCRPTWAWCLGDGQGGGHHGHAGHAPGELHLHCWPSTGYDTEVTAL